MRKSVVFTAPYQISRIEEPIPQPTADQVLVQTRISAISPGTEMLFYRGQAPPSLSLDATIGALHSTGVQYPLRYGYACVGEVIALGADVEQSWLGRKVFAFHPHTSHLIARPDELLVLPNGLDVARAAFYPNMESAVTFVLDGAPAIGERVIVFGAGIVGLLTTALLATFPLDQLIVVDPLPLRRQLARTLGAQQTLTPNEAKEQNLCDFDLSYELSGAPAVLNDAIHATGFAGRVVIASWYGQKRAEIDLGGHFHRSRIQLISSQVSTIDPARSGRWDRVRRGQVAWEKLQEIDVTRLISHRFAVEEAAAAYKQIDTSAGETMQVLLQYG